MLSLSIESWLVAILATAYLSRIIIRENGPLYVFLHLRNLTERWSEGALARGWTLPGDFFGSLHEVLTCPICLPFWVALALLFLLTGQFLFVQALAVAAICVMTRSIWES